MPPSAPAAFPASTVRVAVQTAAAALAAWWIGTRIGKEAETWAVFSAVFVVQGNVGGTLSSAVSRVLGAALGVALALALIATLGSGGWRTAASLAAVVTAMSLVTGRWPSLRYGLVTGTMMVVAPGFDVVENALERSAGILAGAVTGALASVALLPHAASGEARAAAADALDGSARLLATRVDAILGTEGADRVALHRRIEDALARAGATDGAARPERLLGVRSARRAVPVEAVERLWYTLALLDRAADVPLPPDVLRSLEPPLRAAGDGAVGEIARAARAVREGRAVDATPPVREVADLSAACDRRVAGGGLDRRQTEALVALAFAFDRIGAAVAGLGEGAGGAA